MFYFFRMGFPIDVVVEDVLKNSGRCIVLYNADRGSSFVLAEILKRSIEEAGRSCKVYDVLMEPLYDGQREICEILQGKNNGITILVYSSLREEDPILKLEGSYPINLKGYDIDIV